MGAVTKLEIGGERVLDEEKLPPFDISVSANFADLQQVMVRMPVTEPITRAEANRRMDAVVDMAQRQVSRQEIRVNEAALKDKRKALDLQKRRQAEEAEKHEQDVAEIEGRLVKLLAHQESVAQEGAAEWSAKHSGEYKGAVGYRKKQLDGIQKDIEATRDRVKTAAAEYEQKVAKPQADIIERLVEEIAAIERVIEKHREIVG